MKKRMILAATIGLFLMILLAAGAGTAEGGTCGNGVTWTLDEQGILTISGTGVITSHPWTADSVTQVIIEDGVTGIGPGVFNNCKNLTVFVIPDSIVSVGDSAFPSVYKTQAHIGFSGAKALGKAGYSFWEESTEYRLRLRYTYSGDEISGLVAEQADSSVTGIRIPNGVTAIGESAFANCSKLTGISFPDSVTEIRNMAFQSCTGLKSISIPDGVKTISSLAFTSCSSLEDVHIPDSVTKIENYAFRRCTGLTGIMLPDSLQILMTGAFRDCSNLVRITVPAAVNRIDSDVFKDCTALEKVVFMVRDSEQGITCGSGLFTSDPTVYCFRNTSPDTQFSGSGLTVIYLDELDFDEIRVLSLPEDFHLPCGESKVLSPYVFPADGTPIAWSSSNPDILSVNGGTVTAKKAGTAVITATIGSVSDTVTVVADECEIHTPETDAAVPPTCTETGLTEGSHCAVCGKILTAQSELPALGHEWNEPTYEWGTGHFSATATHTCVRDSTHSESETVSASVTVISPTEETEGSAFCSTEEFTKEGFDSQTLSIVIPALNDMAVLRLPATLDAIGEEALADLNCQAIIIADGCTAIGEYAFASCNRLVYIRIPLSIMTCPDSAFEGCNENLVIDRMK